MESVNIAMLKSKLSYYLRLVQKGREVLILDRHRPIAILSQVRPGQILNGDKLIARLESEGVLKSGDPAFDPSLLKWPLVKPKASVLEALLEEREEEV